MQSTGGVADRFAPLAARLERRLNGGLPFAVRFWALTLRRRVSNLTANREAALAAAGAERERIWRLYMTGSALAFERGDISLQQLLAAAPGSSVELPLARPAFTA